MQKPKIVIIGAGMGGLMLANLLKKDGIEATIIEQAPKFKNIGFGVVVHANGQAILKYAGLDKQFYKKARKLNKYQNFKNNDKPLGKISFKIQQHKQPYMTLRSSLQNTLIKPLSKRVFIMGQKVISLKKNERYVAVVLGGGKTIKADLVVGADGVHSVTRNFVAPSFKYKVANRTVWLAWIKTNSKFNSSVIQYWGPRKTFALFPITKTNYFGVYGTNLAIKPKQGESFKSFLQREFGNISPTVNNLTSKVYNQKKVYQTPLVNFFVKPFVKNRVVLIGDAYHASFPYAGLGVSAAFEDAFVLYHCLRQNNYQNIDKTISQYKAERVLRTKELKSVNAKADFLGDVGPMPINVLRELFYSLVPSGLISKWWMVKILGKFVDGAPITLSGNQNKKL